MVSKRYLVGKGIRNVQSTVGPLVHYKMVMPMLSVAPVLLEFSSHHGWTIKYLGKLSWLLPHPCGTRPRVPALAWIFWLASEEAARRLEAIVMH